MDVTEQFDQLIPLDRFVTLAAEQAGVEPEDTTGDSPISDLDFDSLDVLELIMAVEEEINGSINDEQFADAMAGGRLQTVKDVWLWMREHASAA